MADRAPSLTVRSVLGITVGSLLVLGIVAGFWWLGAENRRAESASLDPSTTAETQASIAEPEATEELRAATTVTEPPPTPAPTPVPTPTPTPTPTPQALGDLISGANITVPLEPMVQGCDGWRSEGQELSGLLLRCADPSKTQVVAAAGGRVVHIVNEASIDLEAVPRQPGLLYWRDLAAMGPHVVIDHGTTLGPSNVQTVYARLDSIDPAIRVGTTVAPGTPLGLLAPAPDTSDAEPDALAFSVWVEGQRSDGNVLLSGSAPPLADQLARAAALGQQVSSPTDPACAMVLSTGALPGASRAYRNGTHQGIDFGCGAAGRSSHALAAGTVVYVVDDYLDPTVPDREALLRSAAQTSITPVWTLAMLYGNVVVIDHGDLPGVGRVVTISAHLESVDPAIRLGSQVTSGQRLGEIGNRGTNAASEGLRGSQDPSLHLHWEVHIDGWYLGQGLDGRGVVQVIDAALCESAATPGCTP